MGDSTRSTEVPSSIAWFIGLSCLVFGGLLLILGIAVFDKNKDAEQMLVAVLLGIALIGLGVILDRDSRSKQN